MTALGRAAHARPLAPHLWGARMPLSNDDPQVLLPSNTDLEQQLLGALMANNAAYQRIAEIARPEHFFEPVHAKIFAAIQTLCDRGDTASPTTLRRYFDAEQGLDTIGGASYLARLVMSVVTIVNVQDHALWLRDLWLRRSLIGAGQDLIQAAQARSLDRDAEGVAQQHLESLYTLSDQGSGIQHRAVGAGDSAAAAIQMAEQAYRNRGRLTGVTTGLPELDRLLGGLQRGELIVLGGRPSIGKTGLAVGIGTAAAQQFAINAQATGAPPQTVVEFQLEMTHEQISQRRLAAFLGFSLTSLRDGRLEQQDFDRLEEGRVRLERLPIWIDDTARLTGAEIRGRARRIGRRFGRVGLIVVDHLQLIRAARGMERAGDTAIITEISGSLKALAKEMDCPVLALSQLSRELEKRENKRPQLGDLRASGSIEQDADVVMFVYRDEYYAKQEKPEKRPGESSENFSKRVQDHEERVGRVRGRAEIIVAKQRQGPTGTIQANFDAPQAAFRSPDAQSDMAL